jgi:hypothetical protein
MGGWAQALGICVGWAWYDVVSVAFYTSLPSVRANVLVSLLSALTVTAAGAAAVAWMTTAMDGSRTHLARQLFVLLSNAAALVVGYVSQHCRRVRAAD